MDCMPCTAVFVFSLVPIRAGAGVKGKLNMALWLGLPIVASSVAAEGMGLVDGESVLLATTPEEFASVTSRLYSDYTLWSRLRRGGYDAHEKYYSRRIATRVLNETLTYLNIPRPNRFHGRDGDMLVKCKALQKLEDTRFNLTARKKALEATCFDADYPFVYPNVRQYQTSQLMTGFIDQK